MTIPPQTRRRPADRTESAPDVVTVASTWHYEITDPGMLCLHGWRLLRDRTPAAGPGTGVQMTPHTALRLLLDTYDTSEIRARADEFGLRCARVVTTAIGGTSAIYTNASTAAQSGTT